jgi:hypothetical protein
MSPTKLGAQSSSTLRKVIGASTSVCSEVCVCVCVRVRVFVCGCADACVSVSERVRVRVGERERVGALVLSLGAASWLCLRSSPLLAGSLALSREICTPLLLSVSLSLTSTDSPSSTSTVLRGTETLDCHPLWPLYIAATLLHRTDSLARACARLVV